jgi:hypothetical protein
MEILTREEFCKVTQKKDTEDGVRYRTKIGKYVYGQYYNFKWMEAHGCDREVMKGYLEVYYPLYLSDVERVGATND